MTTTPEQPRSPQEIAQSELVEELRAWTAIRKRPVLLFRTGFISRSTLMRVHKVLNGTHYPKLDVLIESPGGNPDAAFQIANVIRGHSDECDVVVIKWAKSAATLISLAMDQIILGELGELGPLDTQVTTRHEKEWPKQQSALEIVRAMRETQKSALQLWYMAAHLVLDEECLTVHGAYALASEFVGHVAGTHFNRIQLDQFGESVRSLEITKNYAKSLLMRHKGLDEDEAERIALRLVENYASHVAVIDVLELEDIGLDGRAATPDEDAILNKCRPKLTRLSRFDPPGDPFKTFEAIELVPFVEKSESQVEPKPESSEKVNGSASSLKESSATDRSDEVGHGTTSRRGELGL